MRHEIADDKAQSIVFNGLDLDRCKQAMDSKNKVVPNFRLEVCYQKLGEDNQFERTIASEGFSELVNSVNNIVSKSTLLTIFERIVNIATINNGATVMTNDKTMYIAFIPYSPKYTIVIGLQCDLSDNLQNAII